MTSGEEGTQRPETKRGWRFYTGLVLFVLGMILPILGLVIVPTLGLDPAVSAALIGLSLVGGPDVLLIAAGALMGKENLDFLFSKLGGWFKRLVKWDRVSARRYRTGVWLFWISILGGFAFFYLFPSTIFQGGQPGWGAYMLVAVDILLLISFFVLGAEFWGKLQALFVYDSRIVSD